MHALGFIFEISCFLGNKSNVIIFFLLINSLKCLDYYPFVILQFDGLVLRCAFMCMWWFDTCVHLPCFNCWHLFQNFVLQGIFFYYKLVSINENLVFVFHWDFNYYADPLSVRADTISKNQYRWIGPNQCHSVKCNEK